MEKGTINQRFSDYVNSKRNQIFKKVLTIVEDECRKFNVDADFFTKMENPKRGFGRIRKAILDDINDLVRFICLVLDEVEIKPVKSIITIDEKLIKEVDGINKFEKAKNETSEEKV